MNTLLERKVKAFPLMGVMRFILRRSVGPTAAGILSPLTIASRDDAPGNQWTVFAELGDFALLAHRIHGVVLCRFRVDPGWSQSVLLPPGAYNVPQSAAEWDDVRNLLHSYPEIADSLPASFAKLVDQARGNHNGEWPDAALTLRLHLPACYVGTHQLTTKEACDQVYTFVGDLAHHEVCNGHTIHEPVF